MGPREAAETHEWPTSANSRLRSVLHCTFAHNFPLRRPRYVCIRLIPLTCHTSAFPRDPWLPLWFWFGSIYLPSDSSLADVSDFHRLLLANAQVLGVVPLIYLPLPHPHHLSIYIMIIFTTLSRSYMVFYLLASIRTALSDSKETTLLYTIRKMFL